MFEGVAKQTDAMAAMVQASAKGRALMSGTAGMRKEGQAYLPKFKAEASDDYQARLNSSWLFNALRKTIKDMTGRVFDNSVEITEAPQQIIDMAEDIDMQGRDLSVFAAEVFKDAFVPGVSYIMVEAPRRDADTTRAQAAVQGLRPYLVHLRVEDVLGFQTGLFGNVLALSQLRIMESVTEQNPRDEFSQIEIAQVRVLDRMPNGVQVRLYREDSKKHWALVDEYTTEAPEITVIPFYAQRTGFFTGEPVLEDLTDVNIAHWQSQSDQRNILHFARVPILFASGRGDDEPLTISAGTAVTSRDPAATLQWVEHSGKAIDSGRQDLKDLEFQMQTLGLQLLVARAQSATGAALDAIKETSTLAMMADSLKDALEQALQWMAFYAGLGDVSITINVNKEYGVTMMTPQEVMAMQKDVAMGYLTLETYFEERKRRGVLRPDLDTGAEMDALASVAPALTGAPMGLGQ
jgi:hypothetical protein